MHLWSHDIFLQCVNNYEYSNLMKVRILTPSKWIFINVLMFLNFQKKSRCFGETAWRWCFWQRCWKTCWRRKESSTYSKKNYYPCSPWPIQFEGHPRLRTLPHRFRYEILGRGQMVHICPKEFCNRGRGVATLGTGQKFKNGRPKAYFFMAYLKVKNPKVGSFLRASEVRKI